MTTSTSSRSAKATPKTAAEQASNGTQPEEIEQPSGTTSTRWVVTDSDGKQTAYGIDGDGRISYSRGANGRGGELRIYRNSSTKVYDAVISDVVKVVSHRVNVSVISMPSMVAPSLSIGAAHGTAWVPKASAKTMKTLAKLMTASEEEDEGGKAF